MILTLSQWLLGRMEADSALLSLVAGNPSRIRQGIVDRGQGFPYVAFEMVSSVESGADRCGNPVLTRAVFVIQAVVEGGVEASQPFWNRFNALLTGATGAAGGYRWRVLRESTIARPDPDPQTRFYYHGGTWAFEIQEV